MAAKPNRANTSAHDAQLIVGLKKDIPASTTLLLNAGTYTPPSLSALIQSRIDAANEAEVAKANWLKATQQYAAINTTVTPVVAGFKQYVLNAFGKTSPLLADFGITAPKKAVLTPAQKQAAAAKRAATRKARGTTGPKAKLATTGETVRIAALEANQQQPAAPAAAPTAAPAATTPTVPVPTGATGTAATPGTSATGATSAGTASKS
jgi:hypothetical protein